MISLVEGLEVYYNGMFGVVRFVGVNYSTICVKPHPNKIQDVCLLVYREDYSKITLVKQSEK